MATAPTSPAAEAAGRGHVLPRSLRDALDEQLLLAGLEHHRRREAVINVVLAQKGHESVEELVAHLETLGLRVDRVTLERAVRLVRRRNSPTVVTGRLLCTLCGKIEEFTDSDLEPLRLELARGRGFALTSPHIELHGRCPCCRPTPRLRRAV